MNNWNFWSNVDYVEKEDNGTVFSVEYRYKDFVDFLQEQDLLETVEKRQYSIDENKNGITKEYVNTPYLVCTTSQPPWEMLQLALQNDVLIQPEHFHLLLSCDRLTLSRRGIPGAVMANERGFASRLN